MRTIRSCIALLAVLTVLGSATWTTSAEPAGKSKPAAKSDTTSDLDRELLKDLGDDAPAKPAAKPTPAPKVAPAETKPATKPKPMAKPAKAKTDDSLDDELLKELGDDLPAKSRASEKQDTGAAEGGDENDPLEKLTRQMREVERRIRAGDADATTQDLERKIIDEIDKLIKQARQQSSSSSSSSSKKPSQASARDQASQPTPSGKQGSGAGQQANAPARDSSNRVGKPAEVKKPDMAKILGMLKDVWGELPPRLRQQMMQSSVEKFVPKYEFEIEEYFKTLAERREEQP